MGFVWYAVGGDANVAASVGVHGALLLSMCCPFEHAGTALMWILVLCCRSSSGCNRGLTSCGPWAFRGPLGVTRFEEVEVTECCLDMLGNVGGRRVERCCPSV